MATPKQASRLQFLAQKRIAVAGVSRTEAPDTAPTS